MRKSLQQVFKFVLLFHPCKTEGFYTFSVTFTDKGGHSKDFTHSVLRLQIKEDFLRALHVQCYVYR